MSILYVKSNLKHNGDTHKAGSFFEGEVSEYQGLINDGVLRVMDGASTVAQAQEILAKEVADAEAAQREVEAGTVAQNTWEAKKDPVQETAAAPEAPAAQTTTTEPEKPAAPKVEVGQGDVAPLNAGQDL